MVMKEGTVFVAPLAVASATCGLTDGLLPPTVGWAWQATQLRELKRGPSPSSGAPAIVPKTEATSWKRPCASLKKSRMVVGLLAATEESGPPAVAAPPRGPGSVWENAWTADNRRPRSTNRLRGRITA